MKKILVALGLLASVGFSQSQKEWAELLIKEKLADSCEKDYSSCKFESAKIAKLYFIKEGKVNLLLSAKNGESLELVSGCLKLLSLKIDEKKHGESLIEQIRFGALTAMRLKEEGSNNSLSVTNDYNGYTFTTNTGELNINNSLLTVLRCELRKRDD